MRVVRVLVALAMTCSTLPGGGGGAARAAGEAAAQTPLSSEQVIGLLERAERHYREIGTFRVGFRQTFESATFGAADEARGTIHVSPPRRMLWEYEVPAGQRGILDGDTWWFIIPEDREVQIRETAPGSDSPLAELLSGRSELSRYFSARVPPDAAAVVAGCAVVELWPREPRDDIDWVRLEIDTRSADVRRVEAADPLGGRTIVELGVPEREGPLPDSAFQVAVPSGYVVTR